MRDDLFIVLEAVCGHRWRERCTVQVAEERTVEELEGTIIQYAPCVPVDCPILAAAERVAEGLGGLILELPPYEDGTQEGRKEPTPESSTDNHDSGDGDGL